MRQLLDLCQLGFREKESRDGDEFFVQEREKEVNRDVVVGRMSLQALVNVSQRLPCHVASEHGDRSH